MNSVREINVCFIGKHIYPKDIFSNELDMKTWRSLATRFGRLFVIAQSPDCFFHKAGEGNIKIYLIPKIFGYPGFIAGAVKIGLYLRFKYGVDVFDASEIAGGGPAAVILKFFTGAFAVAEIQGEIFVKNGKKNFKNCVLKKIGRFVMRRADRVRVISHAIFEQVKSQGISESKIRLVPLRVDLRMFSPAPKTGGGENKNIRIGYVGRLVEGKGLEDFLIAVSYIKSKRSDFKAVIFGSGPLRRNLEMLAKKLSIDDKIEWRGFVSYDKVPAALSEIDIFVYPSWNEGFGRSIMEALAMEKAVVATKVGGIPDLVKNGENGFLVEPKNPEELSEKIEELIENPALREKFGKAGREWVSENFEWDKGIKKFADLFLELKRTE